MIVLRQREFSTPSKEETDKIKNDLWNSNRDCKDMLDRFGVKSEKDFKEGLIIDNYDKKRGEVLVHHKNDRSGTWTYNLKFGNASYDD